MIFANIFSKKRERRLGYRLLVAIVVVSACMTFVITAIQLYSNYRRDLSIIESVFIQIEQGYLASLADNLWSLNDVQINLQLNGLLRFQDVEFVEVKGAAGEYFNAGKKSSTQVITRQYTLRNLAFHKDKVLGTLSVSVGLAGVYNRLIETAVVILATNAIKTFFIGLFILLITNRWITQHLEQMARYAKHLSVDRLGEPIILARKPGQTPDELDHVATALNDMCRNLSGELTRRAVIEEEKAKLFEAFDENRRLLQAIIDNTTAVIYVKDLDGHYLLVNQRYRELFGHGGFDIIGKTDDEIFPPDIAAVFRANDRLVAAKDALIEMEEIAPHPDGPRVYISIKFPLRKADGRTFAICGISTDITERKRAEEALREAHDELEIRVEERTRELQQSNVQLERYANFDVLTGLANRNLLQDRLKQVLAYATRHHTAVVVLFVDLDHFKFINDSLGHDAGDELLKIVAGRLKSSVRECDTIARIGGDEFVIILHDKPQLEISHQRMQAAFPEDIPLGPWIVKTLQRIQLAVSHAFVLAGRELTVTCSIGVSLYPQDGLDGENLLKNADTAMYRAKELGRNGFQFYTAELNTRTVERLSLQSALRHALEREEFTLHYQPKINLKTGRLSGVEALLRWNTPEYGLVPPNKFIPILEETGLIIDVGKWVMEKALSDHRRWSAEGRDTPRVAINISSIQLQQKNFVLVVEEVIKNGSAVVGLDLEITESLLMQDTEANIHKLKAVRGLGLGIAIDDFGTGYSSLSYLTKLPLDALKIDRSFITNITTKEDNKEIVSTIISLAHQLKFKVVAEGVETVEQANILRQLKCDEMQGFLISSPLPAERFLVWKDQYDTE